MNPLKDIIQRCHQRHEKPLRQPKTRVTPALYKGLPYNFSVYCAWRYPIRLYELEQADISFMPIGRAPYHDHGPEDFGGERFLKRQNREDWQSGIWHRSWGVQVYTGVPSERDGAQWHDIHFKYAAICNAPDAVLTCIDALVNAVANPMLTLTKSGGLRFSCRVQILWTGKEMRFWVLPVLHPSVKQLLFMSSMLSEPDLRRVFPDEEIEVHHIKPTAWHPGNRIFQIRTGIYPRQSILNYDTDWRALGMSEIG